MGASTGVLVAGDQDGDGNRDRAPAEWSIVDAVRHGMSDRTIARLRGISRDAVKIHLANAKAKVGLRTRAELHPSRIVGGGHHDLPSF
jgi:DNA-binding NarL/FixJ family response regulator